MTLPLSAFGWCPKKSGTIATLSKTELIIPIIFLFLCIWKKNRVATRCAVACMLGIGFRNVVIHVLRVLRNIKFRWEWVAMGRKIVMLHWRKCAFWVPIWWVAGAPGRRRIIHMFACTMKKSIRANFWTGPYKSVLSGRVGGRWRRRRQRRWGRRSHARHIGGIIRLGSFFVRFSSVNSISWVWCGWILRGPLARHDRRSDKSTTSRAVSRSLIKRVLDRRFNFNQTPSSRVVSRESSMTIWWNRWWMGTVHERCKLLENKSFVGQDMERTDKGDQRLTLGQPWYASDSEQIKRPWSKKEK